MLDQGRLGRTLLPIGGLTKAEVRERAAALGLRTAAKPDSQDVCFISRSGGRSAFLGARIPLRPARVLDAAGAVLGQLPAVELVTLGQRRGLGSLGSVGGEPAVGASGGGVSGVGGSGGVGPDRRYVVAVDVEHATVTVGGLPDLMVSELEVRDPTWVSGAPQEGETLELQMSAHGRPVAARWSPTGRIALGEPVRRVAPGQSLVLYRGDDVVGGGLAV
jgi:tRNA-specific 2-thiouridylase